MTKKADAATESATFIKYTEFPGIVAERRVLKENLAAKGIEHDGDVIFNKANDYMVDASNFSDEVVSFFRNETGFTVSNSDKAPRLVGEVSTGDSTLASGSQSAGTGGTVTPGGSTASSPSTAR